MISTAFSSHMIAGSGKWWTTQFSAIKMANHSARRNSGSKCGVGVDPTNALINSQSEEFNHYKKNYENATGKLFPIAVVQSTLHEVWARKYSGALKQDLRYSPPNCFATFPFPAGLWQTADTRLAEAGERYHEHRRGLMRRLWLGLTDLYNLFHARELTPALQHNPRCVRPCVLSGTLRPEPTGLLGYR